MEVEEKELVRNRGNDQARRLQRNTEDMLRYVLNNSQKQLELKGDLLQDAKAVIDLLENQVHLSDIKIDKLANQLNTGDHSFDLKHQDILEEKDSIISDLTAKLISLENYSPRESRKIIREEQHMKDEMMETLQNDNFKLRQEVENMHKTIERLLAARNVVEPKERQLESDRISEKYQNQLVDIRNATNLNYIELQKLKALVMLINTKSPINPGNQNNQKNQTGHTNMLRLASLDKQTKQIQPTHLALSNEERINEQRLYTLKSAYQKQVADLRKDNIALLKELSIAKGTIQELYAKLDEANELLNLRKNLLQVDDQLAHTLRSFLNS